MKQGNFTELAKHYHNRPAYSPLLLKKLLACINDAHLPLNKLKVAEVGAGTGKLTAMLARDFGLQVSAVEPNDAMRAEGIKATAGLGVRWHKGSGEDTGLPSGSADWLIMASSFHWTNPAKSLPEFARVLRGGSSHSVNLSENSTKNSQNAQNTHPQTPSAREGAYNVAAQRERERERERDEAAPNSQNLSQICSKNSQLHAKNSQICSKNSAPNSYFTILYNPRDIKQGSVFYEIEQEIKNLVPELNRVSSGLQNAKDWAEVLVSTGHFTDCVFMECAYSEAWSKERYMGAWHSVNDIQVQAGQKRWEAILAMIERKIAPFSELEIPYKIRAWSARKV